MLGEGTASAADWSAPPWPGRADELTVVPWCPFARRWLQEHPDEAAAVTIDWDTPRPSA